jgi:MFS family permease
VPHVLRWLGGLATSLIGNQIYLVALAWVAVQTTTPANVGWILVAGAIPQAALLLVGGALVDRLGPKRVILVSDVLRTAVMVVLALLVARHAPGVWLLVALSVIFGVLDGFFLPAISTAPRYLVAPSELTRVTAAKTLVARAAEFIGSPLASWLLVVASTAAAFWANAGLFALSVVLLALTRMGAPVEEPGSAPAVTPVARARSSLWSEVAEGVRLMGQQRTLSTLLIVVFLMELGFSGPMMAGVPLLAAETGWGVAAVGWVLAGFGLGAAAAAGVLTWRRQVRRTGLVVPAGLTAMGVGVVGLGLLPDAGLARSVALLLAGLLGLVAGLGSGFFGTLVTSVVLGLARNDQIGRVMGALSFSSLAAVPITFALTGLLTGWTNAEVPFLVGGGLVLLAALVAVTNGDVRQLSGSAGPGGGARRSRPGRADPATAATRPRRAVGGPS